MQRKVRAVGREQFSKDRVGEGEMLGKRTVPEGLRRIGRTVRREQFSKD